MTDLEFLASLKECNNMWLVSNKKSHSGNIFFTKKYAFLSIEEAINNSFNDYPGILLYYNNELPFRNSDLICLLFKIKYFWTDIKKQIFYERVILPNLYSFDSNIFNFIKYKLDLADIFNKNRRDISNEQLFAQRIIKLFSF